MTLGECEPGRPVVYDGDPAREVWEDLRRTLERRFDAVWQEREAEAKRKREQMNRNLRILGGGS